MMHPVCFALPSLSQLAIAVRSAQMFRGDGCLSISTGVTVGANGGVERQLLTIWIDRRALAHRRARHRNQGRTDRAGPCVFAADAADTASGSARTLMANQRYRNRDMLTGADSIGAVQPAPDHESQ
jgi:hypothetical protein